jgi:putative intracellular protease/amidase
MDLRVPPVVAVLVFEGFADWEPAFALTGLRRWGNHAVVAVGYDRATVTSMGGLRVIPERTIDEVAALEPRLFLLPGGDMWQEGYPAAQLEPVLATLRARGVPIAGICAATIALARVGLFRERRHTSNGRAFLRKHAAGYETADAYVDDLAVRDGGVISANGLGAVEFAGEIFAELGVFGPADLRRYHEMYRRGRDPSEPPA